MININTASDLVTDRRDIVDGFVQQAHEKAKIAEEYIKEALVFKKALSATNNLDEAINAPDIEEYLLYSAGISKKALAYLNDHEKRMAMDNVISYILDESIRQGFNNWEDQLVYRYLLTKGDSLGGRVRNRIGSLSATKFINAIVAALEIKGIYPKIENNKKGKVQMLLWENRLLYFDKTPKFIKKNIDVILLDISNSKYDITEVLHIPDLYLACGELKGGIDPAGADEHWKTARSALNRIHNSFNRINISVPHLFFIGAIIEQNMAEEIFKMLENGRLAYAANLTKEKQLNNLIEWLLSL